MTVRPSLPGRLVASALLCSLALAACGGGSSSDSDSGSDSGSKGAAGVDLSGVKVTFGSKEFTEQLVLGQIGVQALKAAGATVTDRTNLTGTSVVRTALTSGEIDAYYEYTGTGWITILKKTDPVPGAEPQFTAVRDADKANGITWFARAEANNTFAIAANPDAAKELNVSTLSDYARVAKEQPDKATLCSSAEFINRNDGLPGVEKAYGFTLDPKKVIQLEPALVYTQVGKRNPCSFAVVFATDGAIKGNDLVVLKDDKSFFPPYNISVTMRTPVYQANAAKFDKLFDTIDKQLTDAKMTELNAKVDVDGEDAADVAKQFLDDAGITS